MTTTVNVKDSYRSSQADVIATALDSGNLIIYSGAIPADADDPDTGTPLVTLPFAATSEASNTNGTLTFTVSPNMSGVIIATGGVASHFRAKTSLGAVVFQGIVDTSAAAIVLDDKNLVKDGTLTISSLQFTVN